MNKEKSEKGTLRDRLYGRINVSLKTMDRFITLVVVALVISILCGAFF